MIYYSHINEDSRVERNLLREKESATLVAVAGSGERILAMLDNDFIKHVHAVDINKEALYLLQLKIAALKALTVEEYLQFCGYFPISGAARIHSYNAIAGELNAQCRNYWQSNSRLIEKGIVNAGHFEQFLQRIRPVVNLFLGKKFQGIFSEDAASIKDFPLKRWNLLRRLFSLRWVYLLFGNKDVAFVGRDAALEHIPDALNEIILHGNAPGSFISHLVFKGHLRDMKEEDLPPSLHRDVLGKVKSRLIVQAVSITYHEADILDFIKEQNTSVTTPVFYSLSDILSFENARYIHHVAEALAEQDHTMVWRTFLRNRVNGNREHFGSALKNVSEHSTDESTMMYQVFSYSNNLDQ
ncbi:MAG: DUF3419 family protein [Chitinophagaceae bacterium]|nr:DUF3419 family protein [Chitinophagaceae bacterium]